MEAHLHERLPGEETWECENCGRTVDPLRERDEGAEYPLCGKCMKAKTDADREKERAEADEEARQNKEHWARVEEILDEVMKEGYL